MSKQERGAGARRRWVCSAAAVALLGGVLAGCGGDDDQDGAEGAAAATNAAKGTPVNVWTIDDAGGAGTPTTMYHGVNAAMKAVNADGGLSGTPVNVERCSTKGDANLARQCAQKAVADKDAVAVVAASTAMSNVMLPVLEAANMPAVGWSYVNAADGTSKVSFPLDPATAAATGALTPFFKEGNKRIVLVLGDFGAASDQAITMSNGLMKAGTGQELAGVIKVPPSATDMTPYVAQATADKYDGIFLMLYAPIAKSFISQFRQVDGKQGMLCLESACPNQILKELGDKANGVKLAMTYLPPSADPPGAAKLEADAKAHGGGEAVDTQFITGWSAGQLFTNAVKGEKDLTRESVLERMADLDDVSTGGLYPNYTTTKPFKGLQGAAPRLFNHLYVYGEVKDGEPWTSELVFHDPFAPGDGHETTVEVPAN